MRMRSFFHLRVEVIKDAQICARFVKAKLDILFQFGPVAKEAAARTLEFFNNVDGIGDTAQGEKIFLIGDAAGGNRAQGAPRTQDQDAEEGLFVPQLIQPIPLQELFFGRGESTSVETRFVGVGVTELTTAFFL